MKKLLSLLVTAVMVFTIAVAVPEREGYTHIEGITLTAKAASYVSKTQAEAIAWLNARCAEKWDIDYDHAATAYGTQCVDFIQAYANYLGSYLPSKMAYDYRYCDLRDNMTHESSNPQPGDIFCISPNTGGAGTAGHVGVVISVSGNTLNTAECNWNGKHYAHYETHAVSKIHSYIRPRFNSSTPTGSVMTTGAGKTIPEGDYWISSELDQRYFLDIPGDRAITSADNGANSQMWTWGDQMPTQYDVFHFDYLDNGFYRITQKGSDMSLDVSGCSAERGANVQMWTSNESNAQQWSVEYQSGRGYRLRARCSGFYLDVSGAAVANGTNVQMWTGNDSQAQRFALIPYAESAAIPDGTYKIQYDYNKDYYLTANGDSSGYANTTNVQITSQSADEYEFKYVGEGYYSIVEKKSGLSLDLNNSASAGYLADFTNIQLYEYKGSRNQLWFVQKSSSGTYFIYNKLSGFLLDVKGGQPSEGGDVAQYHYNGSGSQQWNLIRTSLAGDADDNMTVDVSDALLIQQYIAGWDVKIDLLNSNVDGDWFVTVSDVLLIQQAIAGWDVSLECKAPLDLSDLPDMTAHI